MPAKRKFCWFVVRTVPSPYASAIRAASSHWSAVRRPLSTTAPIQESPGCFWAWIPMWSRNDLRGSGHSTRGSGLQSSRDRTSASNRSMPQSATMNFMRAAFRLSRLPKSRKRVTIAWNTLRSFSASLGTNMSRGCAMKGREERPPPTRMLKPSSTVPSGRVRRTPVAPMSLISGWQQWWRQPETAVLNLRGRSPYSSPRSSQSSWMESAKGFASNTSSGSMPDTGQPVTLRGMSPHAPAVAIPTASKRRRMSGTSWMVSQWNWKFWRVVMSQKPRA